MERKFQGRVVLISGGAGGIGRATAKKFLDNGDWVVLMDKDEEALQESERQLQCKGSILTYSIDITNEQEVAKGIDIIGQKCGRIDTFVACSGISPRMNGRKILVEEIVEKEWDEVMAVNIKGIFLCVKSLVPYMKKQGKAQIILLSSLAGRTSSPTAGLHYITSKAAVLGLTKGLASELAPYGIRVNSIAPGKVATKLIEKTSYTLNQNYLNEIPLKRYAQPEEIADIIYYLASDESSYILGANIDVNGGRMMF